MTSLCLNRVTRINTQLDVSQGKRGQLMIEVKFTCPRDHPSFITGDIKMYGCSVPEWDLGNWHVRDRIHSTWRLGRLYLDRTLCTWDPNTILQLCTFTS